MPGKLAVKVKAGRNLPVMDKSSDTTDAYVEIKLGSVIYKTDVCRKSLHPQWNTDWYRFEVDDAELQDEPLQIRLMDYDTYSANDAIGKVNISLNPLCKELFGQGTHGKGTLLTGWLPVFDTMHGIRGEVNVTIKLDLFSDSNKFRQSSCGIHFFHSPCIPAGYRAQIIHGFVEELVVNDDPEYQWIDKIRTPRASNEVRQVVFLKLAGQVQRKMGLKAINMGANSIVGYSQYFDLEGDVGVVARGIGTAVTLLKENTPDNMIILEKSLNECSQNYTHAYAETYTKNRGLIGSLTDKHITISAPSNIVESYEIAASSSNIQTKADCGVTSTTTISSNHCTSNAFKESTDMCRRSSDSDISSTPKGNSVGVAIDRHTATIALMRLGQPFLGKNSNYDGVMLEYPFLTMTKYPKEFIRNIGATVSARSVKLLERIPNPDEPEARDSWWTEIRMEIKSHARSLGCNAVLGYSELTTISDDVCILSATGTAAIVNMGYNSSENDIYSTVRSNSTGGQSIQLEECNISAEYHKDEYAAMVIGTYGRKHGISSHKNLQKNCSLCHIPYNALSLPFNGKLKKCAICQKGRVPDIILTTLEVPECLQIIGQGCFLQAQVIRGKKDLRSELNAKEISDVLPFLEYELQKLLINKLKTKGMNAIFGLKIQVSVGERVIALVATGTALYLAALALPQAPKILAGNSWTDKQKLIDLQKKLQEAFENNQEMYKVKSNTIESDSKANILNKNSDTDSEEEIADIDIHCSNKEACLLEVDDIEDLEMIALLLESYLPDQYYIVNTEQIPGMNSTESVKYSQLFTQVLRAKLDIGYTLCAFQKHFDNILRMIVYKLRTMMPFALCDLQFRLDFPDNDQIQLLVIGVALKLEDNNKSSYKLSEKEKFVQGCTMGSCKYGTEKPNHHQSDNIESTFVLNDQNIAHANVSSQKVSSFIYPSPAFKIRMTAPCNANANKSHYRMGGIDISTLTAIPGCKIEKYLGNLNFFFIRESTSVKESGGISGFVHGFITELLAIVRAHIVAVGGNAMVSFNLTELDLFDNQHKNQGQCLINIGGDAVLVSFTEDQ